MIFHINIFLCQNQYGDRLLSFAFCIPPVHGFLLDKSQSISGQLGTSNQYVTSLEFLDETKVIHLESQQLRRYVDKSLAVLTSQLDNKFKFLEQKLVECENQSVPSHAYESLEQKFMELQHKYENLERKYTDIQTLNKEYTLIKSQLVSVQNKTSELSNDVIILKQLGNIKPLQEIQTLQQAVQTVTAQTHSLSVNERARSQDFLALYNMTIDSKRVLSELNTNTSNLFNNLETKTDKQLLRLEQNHNSTTAGIISKMEAMEKQENKTMSVMQTQIKRMLKEVRINNLIYFISCLIPLKPMKDDEKKIIKMILFGNSHVLIDYFDSCQVCRDKYCVPHFCSPLRFIC
ncbi:unnamed protein product [Mytilus edulis]|uniref:Uncharacterized protein n=1 Tax=Mytilus edulis TaxID=6550 RepID=A0A8S3UK28_MYTED|nr:unnamed protein product [Mytilus edulis]